MGLGVLIGKSKPTTISIRDLNKAKEQNSWPPIGNSYAGAALGGRVGWSKLGLAFGLDLSGSHYMTPVIFASVEERFWTILPGAFVSYQFPIFFRVYGSLIPYGFVLSATRNGCSAALLEKPLMEECSLIPQNIKNEKPVIRSLKLGVGWTGLPFLSINLEYQPFYFIAKGNTKRERFWTHGVTAYVSYIF